MTGISTVEAWPANGGRRLACEEINSDPSNFTEVRGNVIELLQREGEVDISRFLKDFEESREFAEQNRGRGLS